MSPEEETLALNVHPYFLAYLRNKIATYAHEAATRPLPFAADPTAQVEAILSHARLQNFMEALQELESEIITASADPQLILKP
jgi:hypothetical protein